ncbi:MAG: hypothetical protein JO024_06965 [Candidatus Eremiobacteraeota bacterium]|nr:hypothetical protein [Candidatus Eremiobacteraeota bacterium]
MTGLAHVALHVALCGPIARLAPQTPLSMHVRVLDRIGETQVDRSYSLQRGYGDEAIVEFDTARGLYRLQVSAPRYHCSASDFLVFMPDHARNIGERLTSGFYRESVPLILSGTTPPAFAYTHPEFVALDASRALCNQPISNPLPIHATFENDQDSYYAQLYADPLEAPGRPLQLALKLRTAAAQFHYVRIPATFPAPPTNWPYAYELNIPEDYIDQLATEPVDTLLCPKFIKTSVS